MIWSIIPAYAERIYYVRQDPGGIVSSYYYKFSQVNAQYDRVIIDGMCKSACTMVLGIVPLNKICITPRGYFMFHAGHGRNDRIFNQRANDQMLASYAPDVRAWVIQHHALEHVDPYTYLYPRNVTFLKKCQ
jgi:hypothetical protein